VYTNTHGENADVSWSRGQALRLACAVGKDSTLLCRFVGGTGNVTSPFG